MEITSLHIHPQGSVVTYNHEGWNYDGNEDEFFLVENGLDVTPRKLPVGLEVALEKFRLAQQPGVKSNEELELIQRLNTTLQEAFVMVRSDSIVGRGTCSSVDEAMTDQELRQELLKISDELTGRWKFVPKAYLNKVKAMEKIRNDYAEDIRNA